MFLVRHEFTHLYRNDTKKRKVDISFHMKKNSVQQWIKRNTNDSEAVWKLTKGEGEGSVGK